MSGLDEVRRQQLIRAAEGYLELTNVFQDRWPLSKNRRDRLAKRALDALREVEKTSYRKPLVQYLKGQTLRTMERHREAVTPLRRAAELAPDNVHVLLALAWCYKRITRIDLAIESLEEALSMAPDEGIIHYNLACYWSLAGNPLLALQYLTQAFDLDPDYRDMVADESDFDPIRDDPRFRLATSVIV